MLALLLLAGLVGGAGALALRWHSAGMGFASGADTSISIVGPDAVLFESTVRVERATVLSVLLAAAEEAGLEVETEEYPGMGTYVRAIGGHRAHSMSGWIYEVRHAGSDGWTLGDRSAAYYALQEGDAVRWSWTDGR